MTQQFLSVNGKTLHESLRKPHIIKTYSFTTDDDDAVTTTTVGSVTKSFQTVSNHDKLMSMNSPSIDSYNNDGDSSENSKKPQKKKYRRPNELDNHSVRKSSLRPTHSWFNLIDLSTFLTVIILIAIIYVMWIKRDVWVNRLLTSDARMRRYAVDQIENSSLSSTVDSSPQEDIIENTEEKKADVDEGSNSEKVKSRTRKTKQNIINEIRKKKQRHTRNSTNENQRRIVSPPKRRSQQRSLMTRQSTPIHILTYDDVLDQVRKHLKSRRRQRDFFTKLSKATGLRKDQLQRFLYKKNYKIITLETFVTLLDSFNLMLVIVPK